MLKILPHGCTQEHEDLQAEVNAACIGLEHECATLRHEITSTMKTNRELQAHVTQSVTQSSDIKFLLLFKAALFALFSCIDRL
jgi:hypothetical protein